MNMQGWLFKPKSVNTQHDWPESVSALRDLDASLRCKICHEYFIAPKVLRCGHVCTFPRSLYRPALISEEYLLPRQFFRIFAARTHCSDCIRQHGNTQATSSGSRHCPECRSPWLEAHLDDQPVHSLSMAVSAFKLASKQLMATSCISINASNEKTQNGQGVVSQLRKRPRVENASIHENIGNCQPAHRNLRLESNVQEAETDSLSDENLAVSSLVEKHSCETREAPSGCGNCPVCGRVFSLQLLPTHVETCLISSEAGPSVSCSKAAPASGVGANVIDLTTSGKPSVYTKKIPPKVCFNLLKDRDARKKLQDLGLSTLGEKHELEKRYKAFRQYVQTSYDKQEQSTLRSLARTFTSEQQRRTEAMSVAPDRVDGADASFETLIAVAQRRMAQHKAAMAMKLQEVPEECIEDVEEDIASH